MTALAPSADPFVMARLQAWLWTGGAALALLITAIPHPPEANVAAFYVVGAAAAAIAALLRWRAGRISTLGLQVCAGLGTVMVTACIFFSGERLGASASDIEMLYLWIALYSAYFFSLRAAAVQVACIAVAYWLVLAVSSDPELVGARFAQTIGTLGLVAVIVQTLRQPPGAGGRSPGRRRPHRPPHRPAEQARLRGDLLGRGRARPAPRPRAHRDGRRPRPLQARERSPRPPGRRHAL